MKLNPQRLNGILLLNKPSSISSNGALQKVKKLFNAKKAGHTGSLDPLATGMLPICFGEATKFSQFLLESDKYYEVIAKLGMTTTTADAEGEITSSSSTDHISLSDVEQVLKNMLGAIQQTPPMFSAVKQNGIPLYKLARKGIEVERAVRTIHIYELQLSEFKDSLLKFSVKCSKGTYIRTLVEDIGKQLGCGAYVFSLHRPVVVPYHHFSMHTFFDLEKTFEEKDYNGLLDYLLPIESSVQHFPSISLNSKMSSQIRNGQAILMENLHHSTFTNLYDQKSGFIGVGEILENHYLVPRRLVTQVEISAKC